MGKVIVLGDVDPFRRILVSSLRACGVEATEASLAAAYASEIMADDADVVIVHPPQGVFERAYLDQISTVVHGARVFVVSESSAVTSTGDGTVSYVSRVQVRELVDTVRRLAASSSPA